MTPPTRLHHHSQSCYALLCVAARLLHRSYAQPQGLEGLARIDDSNSVEKGMTQIRQLRHLGNRNLVLLYRCCTQRIHKQQLGDTIA